MDSADKPHHSHHEDPGWTGGGQPAMTAAPLRRVDPIGDALYQALQDEEEAWQRVLDVQRVLDAAWDRYRQAERRSARVSKAATRHINRIRQQRHAEGRKAG